MDVDQSAAAIRQIVEEAGEITGSQLARKLRSLAPDWSAKAFGSDSLRGFVEQHVADVVLAGRSGMDLVYKSQSAPSTPESKEFWKTWVSPFGRFALYVEPRTGQVDQVPRAATPPKSMQRLLSPTESDHLELAKAFLDAMPQSQSQLADVLASPERQWWRQWYSEIRKVGQLNDWKEFRQTRLEERLRTELRSLVNDDRAAEAFAVIVKTNPSSRGRIETSRPQDDEAIATRKSLIRAIEQLSDDQVRLLQPLLDVISNALNQRSK